MSDIMPVHTYTCISLPGPPHSTGAETNTCMATHATSIIPASCKPLRGCVHSQMCTYSVLPERLTSRWSWAVVLRPTNRVDASCEAHGASDQTADQMDVQHKRTFTTHRAARAAWFQSACTQKRSTCTTHPFIITHPSRGRLRLSSFHGQCR